MFAQHFKKSEFREWADYMSPRLITMMDVLRFMHGAPIHISANDQSLGRRLGPRNYSAHNIDEWGEVLAVDCFIDGDSSAEYIVDMARDIGYTGIGVYTDTKNNRGDPQPMFHFDVRPTEVMGNPALWGRIDGQYVSIDEVYKTV